MRIERSYLVAEPDHHGDPQEHGAAFHRNIDRAAIAPDAA